MIGTSTSFQLFLLGHIWAVTSLTAQTLAYGEEITANCQQDFCSVGISLQLIGGGCSPVYNVCDDGDENTESTCVVDRCYHKVVDETLPKCFSTCVPDCDSKDCGEDGCGGFCGTCSEGSGCSNFTCVEGVAGGSCESPLHLGNVDEEVIIDTDTRLTIVSTGDTSDAIHFHTPTCNTLTASPELIFKFVVPAGRTYG